MDTHVDSSSAISPSADELLRVFETKDEACNAALRLARSFTGRSTVIVLPNPYTRASLAALCKTMAESCERIAAIVVELDTDADSVYGRFLKKARELASAEGAVLIWCETVANRETFQGGLQALYRIKADLTCLTFQGESQSSWLCGKKQVIGYETPL